MRFCRLSQSTLLLLLRSALIESGILDPLCNLSVFVTKVCWFFTGIWKIRHRSTSMFYSCCRAHLGTWGACTIIFPLRLDTKVVWYVISICKTFFVVVCCWPCLIDVVISYITLQPFLSRPQSWAHTIRLFLQREFLIITKTKSK